MTKQTIAFIALAVGYFGTLLYTARLGRGDSTEAEHLALQTRQDIGSIYGSLAITNGLLAGILAALIF
jgi:hypothetical protein